MIQIGEYSWINESKYLPMFDFILPYESWERIKNKYEFNYDLNLLCFVGHNKTNYLFSVNRKLKSNIIVTTLPCEIWEIILSYSNCHTFCSICDKKLILFNKLFSVCKQWYGIIKKLMIFNKNKIPSPIFRILGKYKCNKNWSITGMNYCAGIKFMKKKNSK